ncbi:hypothetical protein YERSI8AC_60204 [Enterobacterales bacterium 8AC]|nr:hypothetical protein YERSI8AC_60204 [Enterobacterales bacterium 8AC]
MKSETWVAEGSNESINRQFVSFLTTSFLFRKFFSFIMVLIFIRLINRVPFVSHPSE